MNGGVFADGGGGVGPIPDGGYYGYGGGYMYGDGRSSAFVRSPARIGAPVPPAFRPGFRGGGMTGPRVVHH
jgi:hypothetical protein